MPVKFFETITLSPPRNKIYSRLGYSKDTTQLPERQKARTDGYIEEALFLIDLRGCAIQIPIRKRKFSTVILSGDIIFESRQLSKMLADCQELFLMGATTGSRITETIEKKSTGKELSAAVVFDATASEMVDASLCWILDYMSRQLRRENKFFIKKRFSAGYGDFLLDNQKTICDILRMEQIGVTLTENYILVPEKSVTAVTGIKQGRYEKHPG